MDVDVTTGSPLPVRATAHTSLLPLSWALAGGILAGGLLPFSVAVAGTASSGAAPASVTILFVLGALAGIVHGGILAYLARDVSLGRGAAFRSVLLAAGLVLVLALPFWFVALHLALTGPFLARGMPPAAGVALSWLVGVAVCGWAAVEGWHGLRTAFLRWPERRPGSLVLAATLAFLATRFLMERPAIWGTDIQLKGLGAVILALGATLWIALPVVLAALHGAHRLLGDRFFPSEDPHVDPSFPGA